MRPSNIEIGDEYGRLTVIKFAGLKPTGRQNLRYFWCRCRCGKKVCVQGRLLKDGNTQSCGCQLKAYIEAMRGVPKSTHKKGKRFGRLTVLRWHHTQGKKAFFEFVCDCGLKVLRDIQSV